MRVLRMRIVAAAIASACVYYSYVWPLYMCPHDTTCVLILYMYICVLILLYMSSYYYICVRILPYVRPLTATVSHTTICVSSTTVYMSSYYYICVLLLMCVLILLHVCPHPAPTRFSRFYWTFSESIHWLLPLQEPHAFPPPNVIWCCGVRRGISGRSKNHTRFLRLWLTCSVVKSLEQSSKFSTIFFGRVILSWRNFWVAIKTT
jgi:hypothetical protein